MIEIGTVDSIVEKKAKVTIERSAMCGDCGACQVGKDKLTMETTVLNTVNAKVGDKVEVEMAFKNVLMASIIAYGIPLLFFIIGVMLSSLFIGEVENPIISFISGLVLMAVAFIIIKILDKKGTFSFTYEPQITNIITKTNP
ncbi:SoxR reducing system RseC family protein [Alkalibaculum bacchi]|uniref:SoxR reducing system RseC family protein n=1 Tax=Alkalibaculum bacchi TaxID=645887 RepID=UPI0026EB45E4|nr:SoxR reducing system RseC family protein [Alkalibaculum bacchi]